MTHSVSFGLPWWLSGKESTCSAGDAGDMGKIPGWEDPLEEGMATHSSILAWRISMDRGGYSPWGHKESDMTEQLSTAQWRFGELNLGLLSCPVLALAKLTVDLEAWFISCSSLPYT